jgi:sec-independent protein translocase protein TatA
MFNLPGGWELLLIVIVIVVLFGGNKAMARVKDLGKNVYRAKKEIDDLKDLTK